ncbi:MAG: DCC1-like thiol-disulfide oxidoreductase family protein [Cyanobacteriota bacterium]|nr:DCC1-like thiol-disulfide oxidoreductase family protein [Cyanobacteriota bacterium]
MTAPVLVYDGGCPFCRHFAERLELAAALPELQLCDGRADHALRRDLRRRGCDLAEGAVLIEGDTLHHGAAAISWVCARLQPSDPLLHLLQTLFRRPAGARATYPLLLLARRLALAAVGLPLDPDAETPGAPASQLPDGPTLLERERQSRRQGSGLGASDLDACWQLERVWAKGKERSDALSSALLRLLGARLEIRPTGGATNTELALTNAVRLGPLELRFRGRGELSGPRPLLRFGFDRVELVWAGPGGGERVLLGRDLPPPAAPQRQPFFALIAAESTWLAARGRGGGLALWRRRSEPAPAPAPQP